MSQVWCVRFGGVVIVHGKLDEMTDIAETLSGVEHGVEIEAEGESESDLTRLAKCDKQVTIERCEVDE